MAKKPDKTKEALIAYVNSGQDLAESIKRNIVHEGIIDNETVIKLNAFIIASNAFSDITKQLTDETNTNKFRLN